MEIVAHVGIFVRQNLLKLLFFDLKSLYDETLPENSLYKILLKHEKTWT